MRRAALAGALRDRSLRRILLAYGAFAAAEAATWIAILVYAHARGGVVEVGLVACGVLLPTALLAPLAAPLGDRFRRDVVLALGYAAQAAALGLVILAMTAEDASRLLVYGACALACTVVGLTRPAIGAFVPCVARAPEDLAAVNAALGTLEGLGGLAGPLAAAGLLLLGGPPAVLTAMAALMALAAFAVASLGLDPRLARPSTHRMPLRMALEDGIAFVRGDLDLLLLVSCVAAPSVLLGATEVLTVAVATDLLGRGSHVAGVLTAGLGVGCALGAASAVAMIGRRRLAPALGLAGLVAGLPIAALAGVSVLPAALGLLIGSGLGHGFGEVVGRTLIHRASPDRFRARVFGLLEGLATGSFALGGLLVAALTSWWGLSSALLVLGGLVPFVLLFSARQLLAVDGTSRAPRQRVLAALRRHPVFSPLSPPAIERVATRATTVEVEAGQPVVLEGEIGDDYYCVLEGDLEVHVGGRFVRTLGRGESFGEIALLHAVPRTATVTARSPATLIAVGRDDFLETVTRHEPSLELASAEAERFLDERP